MTTDSKDDNNHYFKGFERSVDFERQWHRLELLELWKELAIRPLPEKCDPEDSHLLEKELDDFKELQERCRDVRNRMNQNLPPIQKAANDDDLVPKPSTIPDAGLGLFYEPSSSQGALIVRRGSILCYYTGHLHNFHSFRELGDKSYLMMVQGDTLVDPGPLPHIKARYINDPLNENLINCSYVPEELRSAVTATRDIHPGEEFFVSYGDAYWSQQQLVGRTLYQ
jgi:hypothetical protein